MDSGLILNITIKSMAIKGFMKKKRVSFVVAIRKVSIIRMEFSSIRLQILKFLRGESLSPDGIFSSNNLQYSQFE